MEDGVKTGTKPKKSGFSTGGFSVFTREIWIFSQIECTDPKSTTSGKALIVPVSPIARYCVSGACTYFDDVVLLLGAVALLGMIGSNVAGNSILAKRLSKRSPPTGRGFELGPPQAAIVASPAG
jgi:hypothetical protein